MRKRLLMVLGAVIPFGLAPAAALAESCGDYPLSQAQSDYLQAQQLDIAIPEGDVPFVQRCDVDGNNVIDNADIAIIKEHRGQPAAHPDDPMDWDGNGVIHGRDVGGCASSKTKKNKNNKKFVDASSVGAPAQCYQANDLDGDGVQDFVGIYEYTGGETRGNNWTLQLVILTEDNLGNVQHIEFQYTGQVTDGGTELRQHLSPQLPGTINLNPGSITIDGPGVVSYRDGEPHTIYYFSNGILSRAFYGIDE